MDKSSDIDKLKREVDKIDEELVGKLAERKNLTERVQKLKREGGLPAIDREREKQIIERLKKLFGGEIDDALITKLYSAILSDSTRSGRTKERVSSAKNILEALQTNPIIIAGPCSIESGEQIDRTAAQLSNYGIKFLRGGAFKPRTSPESFQGIGEEGLKYIRAAADKYDMFVVTEAMCSSHLDKYYDYLDVVQIGSRNMASYGFLKEVGKATAEDGKPVLLKRGFHSTLQELVYAANYILEYGNPNVMLCLRGIRTFEQIDSKMRNTPDLASILELKEATNLKVIFDPSHSTGDSKYVEAVSKAALLLGADGLIVETHYSPKDSISDKEQCVFPETVERIYNFAVDYNDFAKSLY